MKTLEVHNQKGDPVGWMIECPNPTCGGHVFDSRWKFNGDVDRPTFRPSMLARSTYGEDRITLVCHFFVTDGKIKFLNDCTHEYAGQTIDLEEI